MSKQNKRGQGRPMKDVNGIHANLIDGIFTKRDLVKANKGNCTPLTVQKHMDWDMYAHSKNKAGEEIGFPHVDKETKRRNSVLVLLSIKAAPKNRKGLGRKQNLFANRTWLTANPNAIADYLAANPTTATAKKTKATKAPKTAKARKARKTKAPAPVTPTAPLTVPAVDCVSPETKAYEATKAALTAPETAPVTVPAVDITPAPAPETAPAPEAVAAETAAVAETATAAVS